ncbi:hypothetical protein [Aureivirga sp. CE67]|uniref:hypothetical protein n=1 Tax=Aureivirga sp. CE67 TaxID=1788983 RepID=UPI0018CAE24C|nr:hypothetical protein [Aureivirga sp. CE67]
MKTKVLFLFFIISFTGFSQRLDIIQYKYLKVSFYSDYNFDEKDTLKNDIEVYTVNDEKQVKKIGANYFKLNYHSDLKLKIKTGNEVYIVDLEVYDLDANCDVFDVKIKIDPSKDKIIVYDHMKYSRPWKSRRYYISENKIFTIYGSSDDMKDKMKEKNINDYGIIAITGTYAFLFRDSLKNIYYSILYLEHDKEFNDILNENEPFVGMKLEKVLPLVFTREGEIRRSLEYSK